MAREISTDRTATAGAAPRWVLPILRELHGYRLPTLRSDILAGITVALISIPQTIGFALIVGISPQIVLYAAIVGVFFTALFSSSRHLVTGPTTSISIILASTIHSLEGRFGAVEIVVVLALLIGVIQVIGGVIKLGTLNRFISRSVIVGYSTGVAFLIVLGQVSNLLGVERSGGTDVLTTVMHILGHVWAANVSTGSILVGVLTLVFLLVAWRLRPRWPGGLVVLILSAGIAAFVDLGQFNILLIGDIGKIVPALPSFGADAIPQDFFRLVPHLTSAAIAIAILGMLETVSLGKAVAISSGQKINANQEIIGLGFGNIMSGLFGTMPGSASFARTATNFQSGGKTQVAAVISALMVGTIILLFARYANFIPIPTLAGMLVFIGLRMINTEQIMIAISSTRSDALVFAATFLSTLFLRLDTAIYVGVGFSLVLFLRKAAMPHLVEYGFTDTGTLSELDSPEERRNEQISIIHVEGELFFGAAELFQDQIRFIAEDEGIRVFILRLKNARHIDATSIVALQQLLEFLKKSDRFLLISGINDEIERVLVNSGFMRKIGEKNVFHTEQNPTMSTKRALLRASHLLQSTSPDIRIFYDSTQKKGREGAPKTSEESGPIDFQI